jgi:NAD(P)-dependent dehydrogenase (short-subunit alcohol dehydrogenase family)
VSYSVAVAGSGGGHVVITELEKHYDDVVAVKGIDLEIGAGEFFSLLGPSGCGKTTTLRMVGGFERPDRGSIGIDGINVTNLGGRTPGAASMPTSISRAAGQAITKGLSRDLAKDNILVTTVCIGLIKSGQAERRLDRMQAANANATIEEVWAESVRGRGVPLGRMGEAEEAGDVITFLASDRASYLTGIAVNIDGGNSAVL